MFDLFYDNQATLLVSQAAQPNEWGMIDTTQLSYEEIATDKASIRPISTAHSQEKYGINSKVRFEIEMPYAEDYELASHIEIKEEVYQVETFTVYPSFLSIEPYVIYGCVKR